MTTEQFIDELLEQRVIDGDLARQLRSKASDGGSRVTPEAILKFLVKTDAITKWKSEELTAMLRGAARRDEPEILRLVPLPDDDEEDDDPIMQRAVWPSVEADEPEAEPTGPPPKTPLAEPLFSSKASKLADRAEFEALIGEGKAASGKTPAGRYKLGGDKKNKNQKRTAGGRNQWDSPLLLLGGGALALLLVAGVLLYYLLFRENAAAVLADADNLFESGAYSQAISRYQEFVAGFASHKDASRAKVQLEMTKLWQSVEGGADPADSLRIATEVIAEIEDEPAFISGGEDEQGLSQAKQDLGRLLIRIGEALVAKADKASDQREIDATIEQLENVLALSANTKYVPEKFRNAPALAAIAESLSVIRSRLERDARRAATLEKMSTAIAAGDAATAYDERRTLLAEYPALANDGSLAKKVLEASAAEQSRVKFNASAAAAQSAWPARSVIAELALAERRGVGGAASSPPIVVRVDGALYGLNSGTGALLWRRFAGDGETATPLAVDGGGVVAADLAGGELWRLDALTGKLMWRLPLEDKITGVIAAGGSLLATSESGKMYVVDAAAGTLQGRVEFGQPIRTAPAINERGNRIYVTAEDSIIYTLDAANLACIGVHYLEHAAGAIAVPPIAVLDKVVVADNTGTDTCRVRVLTLDENGAVAGEATEQRLSGLVITPLATAARRIAAATTSGQVGVFEIGAGQDKSALTVVARREGKDLEPLARFVLLNQGKLWLGAKQLSKLTILPTENQLSVESLDHDYQGDAFDAPLQAVAGLVIHVRRPAGRGGAIVAAMDAQGNRAAWETEIAVPPAGPPAIDAAQMAVTAATASGAVYKLDRQALARGVQDKTIRESSANIEPHLWTATFSLGAGRMIISTEGRNRLLIVDPAAASPVRTANLPAPLTGELVAWNEGIVCPTDIGQVHLIDAATAAPAATPFQPELTPDRKYHWLPPAVAGVGEQSRLLLSDGAERLYLIQFVAGAAPHLDAAKSVDVGPSPLTTRLAVVGDRVIAGTASGQLAAFSLPELTPADPVDMGGRVAWGPFPVDGGALASTDADELMLIGANGSIAWRRKLEHGSLTGRPQVVDGVAVLLHAVGGLSEVRIADGTETGFADIGQPAVAGPVLLGERIVVAAPDGALLVINRP